MTGTSTARRQAFEAIDQIEQLTDQQSVIDRLNVELRKFGYSAWIITGLPIFGEQLGDKMLLNGWPPEWTRLYLERDYVRDDPVALHCYRTCAPFEWKEAPYDPLAQPAAKAVWDLTCSPSCPRS